MPSYFIVRISPSRKEAKKDFAVFMSEIISDRKGKWDKDSKNKMRVGDFLGFITGPTGSELVYNFIVKDELDEIHRPTHWCSNTAYFEEGIQAVNKRKVIILTNEHNIPRTIEWSNLKRETGYKPNYTPRGTHPIHEEKAQQMTFYDKIMTPREDDDPTKFPLFLRISQIPPPPHNEIPKQKLPPKKPRKNM